MDSGCYIAVFRLARPRRIRVGRLGAFRFEPGWYLYCGSAQRGRGARLARHARRDKPLRWHIDFLAVHAELLGAILVPGDKSRECELAAELAQRFDRVPPGFGASDCRCGGHLFHSVDLLTR